MGGPVPAGASHITCGAVLANNATTVLDGDVGPCILAGGLIVDDDGTVGSTVIDLNGHNLLGDFNPNKADCGISVNGYPSSPTSTDVTVKNGTIRGFNSGVCIVEAKGFVAVGQPSVPNDFSDITIVGDSEPYLGGCGVDVFNSTDIIVQNGTISGFPAGLCFFETAGITIDWVTTQHNYGAIAGHGAGIHLSHTSNSTVTNNIVRANGGVAGIFLQGNSDSNIVDNNVVAYNQLPHASAKSVGIKLLEVPLNGEPDNNSITSNQIVFNGFDGISIPDASTGNLIEHNVVEGHVANGIVLLAGASSNTINHNVVCANGKGITPNAFSNAITSNQVGDLAAKHHPATSAVPCLANG